MSTIITFLLRVLPGKSPPFLEMSGSQSAFKIMKNSSGNYIVVIVVVVFLLPFSQLLAQSQEEYEHSEGGKEEKLCLIFKGFRL